MRFVEVLRSAGLSTLNKPSAQYGLSLVLGGAEVTLLDLTRLYASMSSSYQCVADSTRLSRFPFTDRVALYNTFEAMRNVNRPDQMDWRRAVSTRQIAWKTGTSYGSRDGWAIGITPEYAVGVWAGNADGSSVADLTGARTAGPVMFDLFNLLPATGWFDQPSDSEGIVVTVCRQSGHIASRNCSDTIRKLVPQEALKSRVCPYCQEVISNTDTHDSGTAMSRFVLPSEMEHYYRTSHSSYRPTTLAEGQLTTRIDFQPMHIIYPTDGCVISLPRLADGSISSLNCTVAHNESAAEVFWHLDNCYLGSTKDVHQMSLHLTAGVHRITVVDSHGNEQSAYIIVT